ncbi:ABC transporter substrate-binding protein [Microbacterium radiodurans]|uniref:Carbohydrate ABC transporter substrate-binding protein n=1 Tax=Microbacterium radiodurans TaxID=661398 RepID=A0A5J5IPQ3_9MICO|nr:ABC transporter substrate-binding protein [Microbacterium radiodurans]KAA9085452.1 carbohydrate ABC transporter substrate-binding protein [Microbacterium radiodurans]
MTRSTARRGAHVLGAGAIVAATAIVVSGCAGGSPEENTDPDAPVTLNFAWWGDASRAERYEAAIDIYEEENPNVTIRTSYAGFGDYWTARNTEAASRTLPDVIQMDLAYLNEYGSFGHVAPLDDFFGDEISVDGIDETLVTAGEVEGETFGLASASSSQASMFNVPMLEELGIEVPSEPLSWDEYDAFLGEISAAGADRDPVVYGGLDYTQYFWMFQIWLAQEGKSLIDDGALGFEREDLAEWWSRSADLVSSGSVLPPERLAQFEGVDPLGAAAVATDISWDNFLPRFSEGPAAPELTLVPPPVAEDGATGLFLKPGVMMSIAGNSENPTAAARFVDFIVNDPRVGEIFGMSRGVPSSETAREGVVPTELDAQVLAFEETVAENIEGASPAAVRGLGTLEQTFVAISEDVSYGVLTADEAAERWFTEAESALGV